MPRHNPAFFTTTCTLPQPPRSGDTLAQRLSASDQRQVLPLLATLRRADAGALRASTALISPNRGIRAAAHAALGRVGTPSTDVDLLLRCLRGRDDHSVRAAAAAALGEVFDNDADPPDDVLRELEMRALKADEHFIVRYSAIAALGASGGTRAIGTLVRIDASPLEITGAVSALIDVYGAGDDAAAREYVMALVEHGDDLVRGAVARALGVWARAGESDFVRVLQNMQIAEELGGDSAHVRNMLAQALFDLPESAAGG